MKMINSAGLIFLAVTIIFAGSCGRNYIISRSDKPMSEKVLKYLDNDDSEGCGFYISQAYLLT